MHPYMLLEAIIKLIYIYIDSMDNLRKPFEPKQ